MWLPGVIAIPETRLFAASYLLAGLRTSIQSVVVNIFRTTAIAAPMRLGQSEVMGKASGGQ